MAIAIQLDDAFDIETYDGLVAYIIAHLELDTESAAQVPTFIRKAEYRLNRLVIAPERETSATLTTTAGTQSVDLPVDYRQLKQARLLGDTGYPMAPVTLNVLNSSFDSVGKPVAYHISEQAVQFGPVPDAAYPVTLTYIARIPPLSSTNQTNWLLTGNADAYVYAALWQAAAWLEDFDAAVKFRDEMFAIIAEVNLQGNRYRNVSPMRLRSPVVV
jgi:hypothetical protein